MAKRIGNVLKGVAITGTAVTGGYVLNTANLAYAMEAEAVIDTTEAAEITVTVTTEMVQEAAEVSTESDIQQPSTEVSTETVIQQEYSSSEEATEALAAAEEELDAVSTAYTEAGYDNEGLDAQEAVVSEKLTDEANARQAALDSNKNLTTANYYAEHGRGLAIEMIKYKLLLDGEVTNENVNNILYNYYSPNYENNHFCVKYVKNVDGENVYCEKYYDYVTCDQDGKSIFKGNGVNENDPKNVSGINVLEKTPVYSQKDKAQTVWGETYMSKQRVDFEINESGSKKGTDWYTLVQFKSDVSTRKEMSESMKAIEAKINQITSQIADLLDLELELAEEAEVEASEVVKPSRTVAKTNTAPTYSTYGPVVVSHEVIKEAVVEMPTITIEEKAPVEAVASVAQQAPKTITTIEAPEFGPLHMQGPVPLAVVMDDEEIVTSTITDDGVAKNGAVTQASAVWHGATLPLIGVITLLFGTKKAKDE